MASVQNSYLQVNQGTGPKIGYVSRAIASNTVNQTEVVPSLPYIPAHRLTTTTAVNLATANSHLLQVLGPTINRMLLRSIRVTQLGAAVANTRVAFAVVRLSTAGSGGTALTPVANDPIDDASSATGMTKPSSKGTEGSTFGTYTGAVLAAPATAGHVDVLSLHFPEGGDPTTKALVVAAGGTTGIALKNITSEPSATVHIVAEYEEAFWS